MHATPLLAWIYWNPPRILFTIPFIDRPIAFYGLLFVSGFVIGYFILVWLLKNKILNSKSLTKKDVYSWPQLLSALKTANENPLHPLFPAVQHLDRSVINKLSKPGELNFTQKELVLNAINDTLADPKTGWSRSIFENLLKNAIVQANQWAFFLTDRMTWFVVLGTIIGARLGHVFFYDWPLYENNPVSIFKIWEGGLASHGGVLGVIFAVFLYDRFILKSFKEITLIELIDLMVIPSSLVACLIRIGNFVNQEILGPPTSLPWGIIFGDPIDGGPIVPRHPSQLYEAAVYLIIFAFLLNLWRKHHNTLKVGVLSGLFFILAFSSRFAIEFIKIPQSMVIDESFLQMGQYLSLPFILLGALLMLYGEKIDKILTIRT